MAGAARRRPVRDHRDPERRRLLRLARGHGRPDSHRYRRRDRARASDANQGARRVWSDSRGRVWVAEWNAGQVGLYDPATGSWREWKLPGSGPQAYAVYVNERDVVWLTDFAADALVRFDPATEQFQVLRWPTPQALVRELLGRPGEVWGAESATDKLVVYRGG